MKNQLHKIVSKIGNSVITNYITNTKANEQQYNDLFYNFDNYVNHGLIKYIDFDLETYSKEIIEFVDSMKTNSPFNYRYSPSSPKSTIYGSTYACMLYYLLNNQNKIGNDEKNNWIDYFNSFQNEEGYFVDPNLDSDKYYELDWWGAKHLALQVITSLNYLNAKPKYEFNYIKKYYDLKVFKNYLDNLDFDDIINTDSDNAIMNIGCLLQYQRDIFNDSKASMAIEFLFEELEKRINPKWGSWGFGNEDDIDFLSRTQQYAYHLYLLWFYDNRPIEHIEKLIDLTLKVQNPVGGFGASLNSSACEDIDAIYLLVKFTKVTNYRRENIRTALIKASIWTLSNQNKDSGFVFRRNEPFEYGDKLMSSAKNESHLFATWFRTLSLAYINDYLEFSKNFNIGRCPGYHF